jgi:hypothetical protein
MSNFESDVPMTTYDSEEECCGGCRWCEPTTTKDKKRASDEQDAYHPAMKRARIALITKRVCGHVHMGLSPAIQTNGKKRSQEHASTQNKRAKY